MDYHNCQCHQPEVLLQAIIWSGLYGDSDTFHLAFLRVSIMIYTQCNKCSYAIIINNSDDNN